MERIVVQYAVGFREVLEFYCCCGGIGLLQAGFVSRVEVVLGKFAVGDQAAGYSDIGVDRVDGENPAHPRSWNPHTQSFKDYSFGPVMFWCKSAHVWMCAHTRRRRRKESKRRLFKREADV